jgi:hypothetical protein
VRVKLAHQKSRLLVIRADQRERRVIEVIDRSALAQKFRIDRYAEVTPGLLPE